MNRPEHDEAFAVLETALEEELGGLTPADLWERIDARRGRSPRLAWGAAAILLVAVSVVFAVYSMRSSYGEDPDAMVSLDPDGPRSLAEAREWLRADKVRGASVRVRAVVDVATGRRIELHPLEAWFDGTNKFAVRRSALGDVVAALSAASSVGDEWHARGEYTVSVRCGDRVVKVDVRGCGLIPAPAEERVALEFAIVGRDELIPIRPGGDLQGTLDVGRLIDLTADVIEHRGVAVGDAGLRALPSTSRRIRCYGVTAAAALEFARFEPLRQLDLQHSPELHAGLALREIASSPLERLTLAGRFCTAETTAAIGEMRSLKELFFADPAHEWPEGYFDSKARAIDDRSVVHLVGLGRLTELSLGGASISDAGLRRLAAIEGLERLCVSHCANLRGEGFDAFRSHGLKKLVMTKISLSKAGAAAIREMRQIVDLHLDSPGSSALSEITQYGRLEKLFLEGEVDAASLEVIAALPKLRKLAIRGSSRTTDSDLLALSRSTALSSIEIVSCAMVTKSGCEQLAASMKDCHVGLDDW